MGIFSKKSKPKDSNYINFNSALNHPYVVTTCNSNMMKDLGHVLPLTPPVVLKYLGTPRHMIQIEFKGLTLRLCNDPHGDILYDGKRFISDGSLKAFDDTEETTELNQKGMTITLSSSSSTLIGIFTTKNYIRAPVTGYHAYMDETSGSPEPVLVIEFSKGYLDKPEYTYNAITGKSEFKMTTTSYLEKLNNAVGARTANAVHQAVYPGDNFFKFSNQTQQAKKQTWKML